MGVPSPARRKHVPVLLAGFGLTSVCALAPSNLASGEEAARLRAEPVVNVGDKSGKLVYRGTQVPARLTEPSGDDDDAFEDVVAVGGTNTWHCSGAMIAANAVLLARHCLPAMRIAFGSELGLDEVAHRIVTARVHPRMDLAVVRFTPPNHEVRPRTYRHEGKAPSGALRIVGFGTNDHEGRRGYGIKRLGNLQAAGWLCHASTLGESDCDPTTQFSLGAQPNGVDSCSGDSGGPVFEWSNGWRMLGITSRSLRDDGRCGGGGIYERLDAAAKWIDTVLDENR